MKNVILKLFVALLILLVSACTRNDEADYWLQQAETYLTDDPDSARIILQHIKYPGSLTDTLLAKYNYLYSTALRYKEGTGLSDSLLLDAGDIFLSFKKKGMAAKCYLQIAFINKNCQNYSRADSFFMKAAELTPDTIIRIRAYEYGGYCKLDQGKHDEALTFHLKTLQDTVSASSILKVALLSDVGQAYRYMGQTDSSLVYYQKAIQKALQANSSYQLAWIYNKISEIYYERGDMIDALNALKSSKYYEKRREKTPYYLFAQAEIFLHMGETDSAHVYLKRVTQSTNQYLTNAAYQYLSALYETEKNWEQAFKKQQNFMKSYHAIVQDIYNPNLQKMYQDQKLQNENNELKLKQKQKDIYLLSLCLFLIAGIALAYILYIRERRKQYQQVQQVKEQELKVQLTRLEQERELIMLRERATALREQLFRRLSASHKIPSLNGKQKVDADDNKSRLTNEEIDELVQTVNEIWSGFAERLKKSYPLLRPKDIGFCCLLKSGITTKDLASIYYITPSAISQKKTRMKREKFNIEDEHVSLDDILMNF